MSSNFQNSNALGDESNVSYGDASLILEVRDIPGMKFKNKSILLRGRINSLVKFAKINAHISPPRQLDVQWSNFRVREQNRKWIMSSEFYEPQAPLLSLLSSPCYVKLPSTHISTCSGFRIASNKQGQFSCQARLPPPSKHHS